MGEWWVSDVCFKVIDEEGVMTDWYMLSGNRWGGASAEQPWSGHIFPGGARQTQRRVRTCGRRQREGTYDWCRICERQGNVHYILLISVAVAPWEITACHPWTSFCKTLVGRSTSPMNDPALDIMWNYCSYWKPSHWSLWIVPSQYSHTVRNHGLRRTPLIYSFIQSFIYSYIYYLKLLTTFG